MGKSENLTPLQAKLVAQLLTGCTVRAAAQACGVVDKTAFNWLNLPHVKQALAEGTEEIKRHGFEQIALLAPVALNTIATIMNDLEAPIHVRLRAAHILASRLTDMKPVEQPQVTQDMEPFDYSQLDDNELNMLHTLQQKAMCRQESPVSDREQAAG